MQPEAAAARADYRLESILGRLALVFALSLSIGLPGGYFTLTYSNLVEHVELTVRAKAGALASLARAHPDSWTLDVRRMNELLGRFRVLPGDHLTSVRDASGKVLFTVGAAADAPVLISSAPVLDSGRAVGQVEVTHSYRPLLVGTLLAALLGVALSVMVYAAVLTLPVRALRRVTRALVRETAARNATASRYSALVEAAVDAIITADAAGTIVGWNPAAARLFGYTEAEALGQSTTLVIPHRYRDRHREGMRRVQSGGEGQVTGKAVELHGLTRAGDEFPIQLALSHWETEDGRFFAAILHDITQRRRSEQSLARHKDLYAALSQTNQAVVRSAGRDPLFQSICRIAVEHGHFRFAWIGLIDWNDKRLKPAAQYGDDAGYVSQLDISIDASVPAGAGRTARALRTGTPVILNDFEDEGIQPPSRNREAARRAGARAFAAFPIRQGGVVAGTINFYAAEAGFFTDNLIATLEEMAQDLSFALDNFEREAQRKRTEQALAESEARYRSVFANSNVTMLLVDPADGRIVDANAAASAYYGWELPVMRGMNIQDINTLPPERQQADLAWARKEGRFRFEFHHRLASGAVRDVEIFGGAVQIGGESLILSVIHDVTEPLRARRELAESEQRFRSLTELSADWYWEQDREFRLTYRSEDEPQKVRDALAPAPGAKRWDAPALNMSVEDWARHRAALDRHESFRDLEIERPNRHGGTTWVSISGEPVFGPDGEFRGYRGLGRNITERKQAEAELARLAAIVDGSSEAIISSDGRGTLMTWNVAAERMFGYTSQEVIGRNIEFLIPPEDRVHTVARRRVLVEQGRSIAAVETVRIAKGGRRVDVSISLSPVRGANGEITAVSLILRDISERKRAESLRSELEAKLRAAQKMEAIGTLAGGVAHDFNNIIAAILGNVALARMDLGAGHPALVSLEEIGKSGARAKSLVERILSFSRGQQQALVTQPVRPLVDEALAILRAAVPAGVELTATLADMPLRVRADATQIHQMLINLCTNAWHALEGKAGRVTVGLDEVLLDGRAAEALGVAGPGRYVRITVRDNGCGMDAATQERMFEPFFTTKPVDKGTGLGLSVVHGSVKAHEGSVSVHSVAGEGTTVEVLLPITAEATARPLNARAPARLVRGGGRHVLYVDDDESLLFLVTRLLQKLGYRVSAYEDGERALAAVRADPRGFDLVVTDYNMPRMSGLALARALAAEWPGLPVVITSGYITEELSAGARETGVREVVYKPNSVDELCEVIQRILETAHA